MQGGGGNTQRDNADLLLVGSLKFDVSLSLCHFALCWIHRDCRGSWIPNVYFSPVWSVSDLFGGVLMQYAERYDKVVVKTVTCGHSREDSWG